MRIFGAQTGQAGPSSLSAYFLGKLVYRPHPGFDSALKIRDLQRHFTRKQQRCDRVLEFVSHSLAYFLPHQKDCSLVPAQGGPQLASDSVHAVDGEVHVNWNRRADVFQHHVALDRLGFQKRLIDENGHVFLGAQPGQRLG